ncbi:MAG TPA: hypothetical protein VJV78_17525 [Polyangiales bacterium]|nr:hypothetical protein [Polyangiales bacterium]
MTTYRSIVLVGLCLIGCGSEVMTPPSQMIGAAGAPAANPAAANPPPAAATPPSTPAIPTMTPAAMPTTPPAANTPPAMQTPPAVQPPAAKTPEQQPPAEKPAEPQKPDMGAAFPDLRGKCGLNSGYPSDDACISAPAEAEGMQLHVGPAKYDSMADVSKFLMQPGDESSQCFTFQTPNDKDIYYQGSVLSGRAGTHHIISTMYQSGSIASGGFGACSGDPTKALGSIPGASKSYMPRTPVAPEYSDVGRKIVAKATIQSDMHYFNFTDKPLMREYWLNIYYVPAESIKREALQMRGFGGLGWSFQPIQPGTDKVYKYQCPVKGNGYIMNLLGHYHAHGKRLTASIQRKDGKLEKVFEMYDYLDPASFDYNTVVDNPLFADGKSGATSGQLAVSDGDIVMWECHIINDSNVSLSYTNEVKTGEMCNLWGASVGIQRWGCDLQ